ncbi:MAG: type II secretion system protein [Desulfobacteraceae bacterium]|nr:type II secretion system protein [Desulfobacteraceae bacterium]
MEKIGNFFTENKGFTLIEVVAVLVMIGIISAVIMARANTMNADVIGDIAMVKSHLRYAQGRAMANDANTWSIVFAGSSYALFRGAVKKALPGGNGLDISFAPSLSSNETVAFDWWGAPYYTDAGLTLPKTDGSLALGGGNTIIITPVTGFIP